MRITNVNELYVAELRDLLNSGNQILDALPKFTRTAVSPKLIVYLKEHLGYARAQAARLNQMFDDLEVASSGSRGSAMEGLILEVHDLTDDADHGPVLDAALIAGMHGIEHAMIADYNTALAYAKNMGNDVHSAMLKQCLNEEHLSAKNANGFLPGVLDQCDLLAPG